MGDSHLGCSMESYNSSAPYRAHRRLFLGSSGTSASPSSYLSLPWGQDNPTSPWGVTGHRSWEPPVLGTPQPWGPSLSAAPGDTTMPWKGHFPLQAAPKPPQLLQAHGLGLPKVFPRSGKWCPDRHPSLCAKYRAWSPLTLQAPDNSQQPGNST